MTAKGAGALVMLESGRSDSGVVLSGIRRVLEREYGLRHVSLRAVHSDASRFSFPIIISGSRLDGGRARYFAKLLASRDLLAELIAQVAKNLYLQASHQDPIFGYARTAEEMARQEYDSLRAIQQAGIPTANPLGYHSVADGVWLFVAEFLSARPVATASEFTPEQVDRLFGALGELHRHGVYHGDIKAANILLGDRIYLIDTGVFREGVASSQKAAYDVACLLCTFLGRQPLSLLLRSARRYHPPEVLRGALDYLDLIQKRQDFLFDDRWKERLRRRLATAPPRSSTRAPNRPAREETPATVPLRRTVHAPFGYRRSAAALANGARA